MSELMDCSTMLVAGDMVRVSCRVSRARDVTCLKGV